MNQWREWVEQRVYVDVLVEWAVIAGLILALLVALSAIIYWIWWVRRLLRNENVADFVERPIPGFLKLKVGSGEVELASAQIREGLPEFERGTQEALRVLNAKVQVLEEALENWEDVTGDLPRTGGRDAGQ